MTWLLKQLTIDRMDGQGLIPNKEIFLSATSSGLAFELSNMYQKSLFNDGETAKA
jgi:hypothetical protein